MFKKIEYFKHQRGKALLLKYDFNNKMLIILLAKG